MGTLRLLLMGLLLLDKVLLNATVEMKTKIYNRNFTQDLRNKSSAAFRDFEKEFQKQVRVQQCREHPHAGAAAMGGYLGHDGAGAQICPRLLFVFQMRELYKDVEGYQGVVIHELQ